MRPRTLPLRRDIAPPAMLQPHEAADPLPVETAAKPVYRVPLLTRGSCNALGQTTGIAGEKYPLNLIWIMPAQGSVRISPPHLLHATTKSDSFRLVSRLASPYCFAWDQRNALKPERWSTAMTCMGPE